ncbi:MAG: peptidoglycan-binding protein [Lachnospiraceae bacterium]|nr:peptidoglycan-binding protein [Lachnospiraceae bacterium]GFI01371.1 cell division suppressor protein YneA [Lachnospiraceae bacterium]
MMNAKTSERRIRNNRIKRRRELRQRFIICIFTFLLVVTFSSLFFSFKTKAQGSDKEILYKYYKSIVVQDGDTLWNYACQYGEEQYYGSYDDYINEVICINSLSDDKIIAGQHLILPYYSTEFVS